MNASTFHDIGHVDTLPARLQYFLLYGAGTLVFFVLPIWGFIFSEMGFSDSEIGWLLAARYACSGHYLLNGYLLDLPL